MDYKNMPYRYLLEYSNFHFRIIKSGNEEVDLIKAKFKYGAIKQSNQEAMMLRLALLENLLIDCKTEFSIINERIDEITDTDNPLTNYLF